MCYLLPTNVIRYLAVCGIFKFSQYGHSDSHYGKYWKRSDVCYKCTRGRGEMHRIPAGYPAKNPLWAIQAGEEEETQHSMERVPGNSASRR